MTHCSMSKHSTMKLHLTQHPGCISVGHVITTDRNQSHTDHTSDKHYTNELCFTHLLKFLVFFLSFTINKTFNTFLLMVIPVSKILLNSRVLKPWLTDRDRFQIFTSDGSLHHWAIAALLALQCMYKYILHKVHSLHNLWRGI